MIILSLFDGISCGQVALERTNIKVDKYYASEIDKYAIKITQKNYPNTIQLGDITKWKEWNINWKEIDLILAGSPCQGFSRAGKGLNFNDPRSKLFFEFLDILNYVKKLNPNVKFLLENVRMKKEFQNIISEKLGVTPILINSALVSAQNRVRLYWTTIKGIEQPENKHIYLKDIIECGEINDKYWLSKNKVIKIINTMKIKNNYIQYDISGKKYNSQQGRLYYLDGRSPTIPRCNHSGKLNIIKISKKGVIKKFKDKLSTLTGGGHSGGNHSDMDLLLYYLENKIRRITPIECERLQTLPDNYTEGISNTQRYKCLGNGWTVDVIIHILKNLKETKQCVLSY